MPLQFPVEVPTTDNSVFCFESFEHLQRTMIDFEKMLDLLEEIGGFDSGWSGDKACTLLKELGVWNKNIERVPDG